MSYLYDFKWRKNTPWTGGLKVALCSYHLLEKWILLLSYCNHKILNGSDCQKPPCGVNSLLNGNQLESGQIPKRQHKNGELPLQRSPFGVHHGRLSYSLSDFNFVFVLRTDMSRISSCRFFQWQIKCLKLVFARTTLKAMMS